MLHIVLFLFGLLCAQSCCCCFIFRCSLSEGGVGFTSGKLFQLTTYYAPYWFVMGISAFLLFCIYLVKSYSYPATANGAHQVEVCIRRLTWYAATLIITFLYPTFHSIWFQEHSDVVASLYEEVWYSSVFVLLSLFATSFFFALGVLLVELHMGKRDKNIVKGDPLMPNPVPRDNLNLEDMPNSQRAATLRDRFWLLMNTMEERKDTVMGETCARCSAHGYRPILRKYQEEEAKKEAEEQQREELERGLRAEPSSDGGAEAEPVRNAEEDAELAREQDISGFEPQLGETGGYGEHEAQEEDRSHNESQQGNEDDTHHPTEVPAADH